MVLSFCLHFTSSSIFPPCQAHFYWVTRDPSEFIFGAPLLRNWLSHRPLHAKIVVHLYTTARCPDKDLPSFLFKECLKRPLALALQSLRLGYGVSDLRFNRA